VKRKKSWREKLAASTGFVVKPAPIDIAGMKTGDIMLVPAAGMIDDFIRGLPPGTSIDVRALRRELAQRHGAKVTCPITTGFHLRTVAEAAYEAYRAGAKLASITPFWRVLDEHAPTVRRLACGIGFVTRQRRREQRRTGAQHSLTGPRVCG